MIELKLCWVLLLEFILVREKAAVSRNVLHEGLGTLQLHRSWFWDKEGPVACIPAIQKMEKY